MAEPLSLRLNIQSGVPEEDGPFTRVHTLKEGEHQAYLLLVAEAKGPDPEEACSWALDRIHAEFSARHRSATGRLQEALRGIHEALAKDNSLVFSNERTFLSLLCGYLRGQDLYLAHVGPALGYVIGPGSFRPLAPTAGHDGNWLGEPQAPNIWVRHHRMAPEEILLLAGSDLGAAPGGVLAAFQECIEAGMAEVYRKTRTQRAFGALAVALLSPESVAEDDEAIPLLMDRTPYRHRRQLTPPGGARPVSTLPPAHQAGSYPLPPSLNIDLSMRPPPRRGSRWARQLLTPKLLTAVLAVFILGGLLLGVQAVGQGMAEQSRQQTAAMVDQARSLWDRAKSGETADKRRELLNAALKQVETIQRQAPDNREALGLAEQVKQALAAMDAVTALRNVRRVVDFTDATKGPVLLRSPVYQDDQMFVLDKLADRVYQVPLNTTQGDGVRLTVTTLPPSRNPARRNMAALFWMPKGGAWSRDSLFSLDDNRAMQEMSTQSEPRSIPLRGAQDWSSLQAARGFAGNLYVLDPKASQVWRYAPTDSGFDSERRAALPSLDLSDAVDLLVDGDVYVLLRTGKVVKVTSGRIAPFSMDGLDRVMLNATALGGGGQNQQVYVADQGNKRVVAFDKNDGRFVRQFATGDIPAVRHVWVDEATARVFLLTDNQLYAAGLPQ